MWEPSVTLQTVSLPDINSFAFSFSSPFLDTLLFRVLDFFVSNISYCQTVNVFCLFSSWRQSRGLEVSTFWQRSSLDSNRFLSPSPFTRWFRVLMTQLVGDESLTTRVDPCEGSLYTSMLSLPSSPVWTAQSKRGRQSPLTSSTLSSMLLSTAFICSVKASTPLVLMLTQVWSTCLKQCLGAGPVKVIGALLSTSSM